MVYIDVNLLVIRLPRSDYIITISIAGSIMFYSLYHETMWDDVEFDPIILFSLKHTYSNNNFHIGVFVCSIEIVGTVNTLS